MLLRVRIFVKFRLPEELYRAAQAVARSRHETVTSVVVAALRDYVERWGPDSRSS